MSDAEPSAKDLAHGTLGKELFVVMSTPAAPREELAAMLPVHLEHQIKLEKQGILFGAGPVFDKGASGPSFGLIIIRADSFDAAQAIAESDPFHKSGLRTFTLQRWILNEGSYTVTVNYSDQTAAVD